MRITFERNRHSNSESVSAFPIKSKPCGYLPSEAKLVSCCRPRLGRSRSVPQTYDNNYTGKPLFWFRAKAYQKRGCSTKGICEEATAQQKRTNISEIDKDKWASFSMMRFRFGKADTNPSEQAKEISSSPSNPSLGCSIKGCNQLARPSFDWKTGGDNFFSSMQSLGHESLVGLDFLEEEPTPTVSSEVDEEKQL